MFSCSSFSFPALQNSPELSYGHLQFFTQSFESTGCGPEHDLSFYLRRAGCTACRVLVSVLVRPSCWAVPAPQHWEISGSSQWDHPNWSTWHNAKQGSLGPLPLPTLEALQEADLQSECTCLENLEPPAHIPPAVGCSHWSTSQGTGTPHIHQIPTQKTASKGNTSRISFVMVLSQHSQASSTHLVILIPVFKANVLRRGKSASPLLIKSPELRSVGGGIWRRSQAPRSSRTK